MIILAVMAAGLGAWCLAGPPSRTFLRRVRGQPTVTAPKGSCRRWLVPAAAGLVAVGLLSATGIWLVVVALVGGSVAFLTARRRAEAKALITSREVARACRVLDSLLGQGHVPLRAIILAAQECPILQVVASTAEMGGEAVPLLRELGSRPGAAGLLDVARAWEVTERTGAPLHGALARVKVNLAARADLASVIAQELAAPRATSQLLAVLPVVGLGLGYLVGGDPVAFLTATTPGRLCFMAGIALACVGAVWSDALAAKASALSRSPDRTRRWAGLRRRKWVGAAPDGGWSP